MYQLGSLFIFGQKLIMRMLGAALRTSCCLVPKIQVIPGSFFFPASKDFLQQNHIGFDIKGL